MENVASVIDRIRTIESRINSDVPPAGFDQALAQASAQDTTTARGGGFQPFGVDRATRAPAGLTLAQILGRPLSPGSVAGAPTTFQGTAGVATSGGLHLPVDAPVSSGFGPRVHPVTGKSRLHAGIDLAAPTGTPIGAAAAGTVTFAGVRGGYGNLVIVDHGDGTETRYAHQDTIAVTAGQRVGVGDLLGTVGSTGQSTGPHLHLEFRRDGEPVDPAPLLGLS